jgi:uncharacterized membrane protein
MGLLVMIVGLLLFIGAHAFVTLREARASAIGRLGEGPYKGLFTLVSILGVVLIGFGFGSYRAAGLIELWSPPLWTRHVAALLMLFASIFVVAAYSPGRIKTTLKHPMLVGVKTWALAHLITNGDLGSLILFGSLLAWAVFDRISLKRRTDPGAPPIPVGGIGKDAVAVAGGIALFFVLGFLFHPYVVGVPAFAGR